MRGLGRLIAKLPAALGLTTASWSLFFLSPLSYLLSSPALTSLKRTRRAQFWADTARGVLGMLYPHPKVESPNEAHCTQHVGALEKPSPTPARGVVIVSNDDINPPHQDPRCLSKKNAPPSSVNRRCAHSIRMTPRRAGRSFPHPAARVQASPPAHHTVYFH